MKNSCTFHFACAAGLAVSLALAASLTFADAPDAVGVRFFNGLSQPVARTSEQSGVTVKVTPKAFDSAGWSFAIVLDTHAGKLDDNLESQAVMLADKQELKAVKWEGPGPGGHHREGVLAFPAPEREPSVLEVRIRRVGEEGARVFRWEGAALK